MPYKRRSTSRPMVKMGPDGEGQRSVVEGKLVEVRPSEKYPENPLFDFDTAGGPITVFGCAALNRALKSTDIGLQFRVRFTGYSTSKNGSKVICLEVDEWTPEEGTALEAPPPPDEPPLDAQERDSGEVPF